MTTTSVALFLAREMGHVGRWCPPGTPALVYQVGKGVRQWVPHENFEDFSEVLEWAMKENILFLTDTPFMKICWVRRKDNGRLDGIIDTREDFIAATLLAIAKARGYEDEC